MNFRLRLCILSKNPTEVTALTSGAPVSVCLTTGQVNPEHVVKVVAARPLLCKVTIFPFVNNHSWGDIL